MDDARLDRDEYRFRESEFLLLLGQLLPHLLDVPIEHIQSDPRLGSNQRPDFLAANPLGQAAIVEAKVVTPQTDRRLRDLRAQMLGYRDAYIKERRGGSPRLIVALTSALSERHAAFLAESGIEVFDGPLLAEAAHALGTYPPILMGATPAVPQMAHEADELIRRLAEIPPGRSHWSPYQKLVADILGYLFCPPLGTPQYERANATKVNRRDVIMSNYTETGFWSFMRAHYEAHYVVVDAKNSATGVKKDDILQVANYLSSHGAGLFGMVFTRTGSVYAAEMTRREQWAFHRKLVLIFNDGDLVQMLTARRAGSSPDVLVRQKIEDFRLAY